MKKTSLLFAIASIALITLPSCKKTEKEPMPVTETVNTTVKVNETYSYVLPSNEGPEPYTIVKQSDHTSTSVIEKNADGNFVYKYTPTANFSGTDVVIIADGKEGHGACGHPNCDHPDHPHNKLFHHGDCQHKDGKQKHIITINFTIAGVVANTEITKATDK